MLRIGFRKSRAIVLAASAIAAMAGVGALTSDVVVSRGFGKAFENSAPALSFDTGTRTDGAQVAASGDEGYWLTRAEMESPSPFARPLTVGDRITIAGRDGHERRLEVIDLKAIGDQGARGAQLRLILVTCRVTDAGSEEATVRFVIEAEPPVPARPQPAKAL
jgi:hypothetical protein